MRSAFLGLLTVVLSMVSVGGVAAQDAATPTAEEIERRVDELLSQMTLEEKIDIIGGYEAFNIRPIERLGIPKITMADGPLGVRNYGKATAFPAGICMAATWNTDLVRRYGEAVGEECRAKGVHILLSPGLNIYRAPMCGRNFEYYGEDPYLAARMAAAYVGGVQSRGVVATAKHFAANNQEYDRHDISSDMDERTLREIYLPAFRAAVVEAGAGAVMTAYNLVNGVHCSENAHLILDILKGEWGFDGLVMSDWGSTYDAVASAKAGLDLEMPSGRFMNRENLMPAIADGSLDESVIDDKVRRILRVSLRFGFFDRPQLLKDVPRYNPASRLAALEAAREGLVLLKNDNRLLPLDRGKIRSIGVFGPDAYPAVTGAGGSSRVEPFRAVGIWEGLVQGAGEGTAVHYSPGPFADLDDCFASSRFYVAVTGEEQDELRGLFGEYFSNKELSGRPATSRTDRQIDFAWTAEPVSDLGARDYSVRWTGFILSEEDGEHMLAVRGDDGYRLYVDDSLVIDAWREQAPSTSFARMTLEKGKQYRVRLEYFQSRWGAEIHFGWIPPSDRRLWEPALLAAKVDVAVVCVGFDAESEGEGADRAFELPAEQIRLIDEIAAVNKSTIVVLTAGGNVDMRGRLESVPALLHCWYPGQEGGTAVADIIFGDVNPSGKLPATFEKSWEDNACFNSYHDDDGDKRVAYSEGVFIGYRHFDRNDIEPLFPFGFGLSYTEFEYSNLELSSDKLSGDEKLTVTCEVRNSGALAGAEVAQLYVSDREASVPRPVKELKGFAKVRLEPGQRETISFEIDRSALAYFDVETGRWIAEPGEFEVLVGASSRDIRLRVTFVYAQ